ncbi:MAG: glycosyl transferase, family 39 [Acidobacteriaceae bacterium]|nr:glycosyl transferase, family 39 [Acidobacteriaceae bacterium]
MASPTETHIHDAPTSIWSRPLTPALLIAAFTLLLHMWSNGGYGYFRDELYFLACGDHLAWGYADMAPMVALVAKISRALFGDSLHAIRLFPALAGATVMVITGLITRELGGKRFAVFLACLCVLVAPIYLAMDDYLSMNAFEPIFWMGGVYAIILAIKRNDPKYWLWFGVFAGLGLMNKHSTAFFGLAVLIALLLTPERRFLTTKWIWIASAIVFVIFAPNLLWQIKHHWATLELLRNVQKSGKDVVLSPLAFVGQQIFIMHPLTAPVWIAGIYFFLFDREGKRFRVLGLTFLIFFATMMAMHGKNYYLAPIYPMMLAGGAVLWERWLSRKSFAWAKFAYPALLVVAGVIGAPLVLPVLPVETFLQFESKLGLSTPKTEVAHKGVLPQHFGDRFGWPEMVEKVAKIYNSLSPEERAKTAIFASNYGEAGAIDFFGPKYGLPKAISGHQNYWFWGPRNYTGEIMIVLQDDHESLESKCASVEEVGMIDHPYAMAEEHNPVFICRGRKKSLQDDWPKLKHWN